MSKRCLLLVAHGTPSSLDDLPDFLNNIRRGRPTPLAVVEEVRRRYEAIGGQSPVLEITKKQAKIAGDLLGLPAFVTTRMWHPYFHEVLADLSAKGFEEAIVVVMAAHSAHVYEAALQEAVTKLAAQGIVAPKLRVAPCWGDEPSLIESYAELSLGMIKELSPVERDYTLMVSSAHSLPMRAVSAGDPYPRLVEETANLLVNSLGANAIKHTLAFQSQGMSLEAWLGPDLAVVFDQAKADGIRQVMIVPVGFLADHVETLFDLDIEAKQMAHERGLGFLRCPCPNLHEKLISAIVKVASGVI